MKKDKLGNKGLNLPIESLNVSAEEVEAIISRMRLDYLEEKFLQKYSIESLSILSSEKKRKKLAEIINNILANERTLIEDDRKSLGKLICQTFFPPK